LQLDDHIYELFRFVTGYRYDGSEEATIDTGRQLALLHKYLDQFAGQWTPLRGSFHDSSGVRRHIKMLGTDRSPKPDRKVQRLGELLMTFYNASSTHVNELGFDSWPEQVVHGDWHPGNMLFYQGRLIAVLDFDSVRTAPPVTDLANGLLQFSIVGGRPNPAEWPEYLDQSKLAQFLKGYLEVIDLDKNQLNALLDLMTETMIAEAVMPVAQTGFFGHSSGLDFLKMIQRKAEWIDKNRNEISDAMRNP
jgi:Ser/Thr protein kinase RdoA (MazF antagonist)